MSQNSCECTKPVVEIPVQKLILQMDAESFPSGSSGGGAAMGEMPNLQVGVETTRNMLYKGKQVYSQLVPYGTLPNNSSRMIAHNIPDVDWIQVDFNYTDVRDAGGTAVAPTRYANTTYVSKTQVGFSTRSNQSIYSVVICLNYTKTTDPVIG